MAMVARTGLSLSRRTVVFFLSLKRIVAQQAMDIDALKELLSKKW
jgi:hypothetical protein